MATVPVALSPQFPASTSGKPNGLLPQVVGNVKDRLILQEGTQGSKDDFNMDVLSVPFKIFAGSDWKGLLPMRGDSLKGFPNMIVWDPLVTFTVGRMWVELRMLLRGLRVTNGVSNLWNGFLLNPPPRDATGMGSVQIVGTDNVSVLDLVFYRPQTTYRYVTTARSVAPPQVISNPAQNFPVVLSYSVRGQSDVPDLGDSTDGGDKSAAPNINGFQIQTRQRCTEVSTVQVGSYFQNEATVVYEFYSGSSAS